MKIILSHIWRYIGDIFFDDLPGVREPRVIAPKNLITHYRIDLPDCVIDEVIVALEYIQIADMLERYKYHSDRSYADEFADILSELIPPQTDDGVSRAIVTVPMHWSRYSLRGFDHMDLLARKLAQKTGLHSLSPLSTSFSRRQSKLSRAKRLENRKNHFIIDPSVSLPYEVLLIDDVISTGATANECARMLKEHGVQRVVGIFLSSSAVS